MPLSVGMLLFMWLAATSLTAFIAAVVDKHRARRQRGRRVPERTLLALAAVGGSPGLVLAMLAVRHKTRKGSFLARLAGVLVAQAIVVAVLFMEWWMLLAP